MTDFIASTIQICISNIHHCGSIHVRCKFAQAVADVPAHERKQLQRFDWLETALDIFVAEGIDAVRITRLADDLGATWRQLLVFRKPRRPDRRAGGFRKANTPALTTAFDQTDRSKTASCVSSKSASTPRGSIRARLAIREWARRSSRIRQLVDQEDQSRIDSLRCFFEQHDYPMPRH